MAGHVDDGLAARGNASHGLFFFSNSFSEIESAKSVLEALSTQFLTENRIRRGLIYLKSMASGSRGNPVRQAHLAEAVKDLEQGVQQFKGTVQELYLVQDTLWVLKKEKLYDRWLDLYLSTLYQHPMDDVVGHYANEALLVGQAAGREEEVLEGLRHLCGIPLEFDTRHRIEAALVQHSSDGSEILTSWKLGEFFPRASDLPHPSPLPLGEGESMSALDKTGVFGLGSDWLERSLSQRERAGVREKARQIPHASKVSTTGKDLCGHFVRNDGGDLQ